MKRCTQAWLILSLILGLTFSGDMRADEWLVLNPLQISLFARYDSRSVDSGNDNQTFRSVLDTGIEFIQGGYVLDPGIALFSIKLIPTYTYGKYSDISDKSSIDDTNINYNIWLNILSANIIPVGARLGAIRSATTSGGGFGSYTRTKIESNEVRIDWKNSFFPANFTYEERTFQNLFRSGLSGTSSSRDELTNALRLKARSSRMNLFLEAFELNDRIEGRSNDFNRYQGRLLHRLD